MTRRRSRGLINIVGGTGSSSSSRTGRKRPSGPKPREDACYLPIQAVLSSRCLATMYLTTSGTDKPSVPTSFVSCSTCWGEKRQATVTTPFIVVRCMSYSSSASSSSAAPVFLAVSRA